MRWLAIVSVVGFGCGSSSSSPTTDAPKHIDAPAAIDAPMVDAPPPTALTVDCATVTPVTTVTATTTLPYSYQFSSGSTIAVNDVVMFMMPGIHNVVPDATMSDTGLHVGFGETKCLKFTVAGAFHFHCQPHGFEGVITAN
jgi:plastocyanin